MFALALAIFTLASVLCGLSTTLDQFVAMRVLQGMGGALMVPVGRGRATHHAKTSAHHGNRHPDVACAGRADHRPTAGGFITSYADWRWIFFINVPLGIIAILLALRIIPDLHEDTRRPFDLPGFVVTTLAMVSPVYAMELMGAEPLRTGLTATLFIVGVVALSPGCVTLSGQPADDQTRCDAGADVSRHPVWRIAVSRLHQRGSVPVTADVPGRLWHGRIPFGPAGAGGFRWQSHH